MESIDLIIILTTAFLGSVGHCIGMCGGIVMAYSSAKIGQKTSYMIQTISHLSYNLGRVTTYTMLGAIFGLMGQVFAFSNYTKGILFFITGLLMILTGLSLIGGIRILNSAEWSISKYTWYQLYFKKLIYSKNYSSFYLLGILNGLIPCGLVYSFAIFAASTADPFWGAVVMAIFGLATIPAMFFLGFITKLLQKGSIRVMMMKLASIFIILYGAITILKGYGFVFYPDEMHKRVEMMSGELG